MRSRCGIGAGRALDHAILERLWRSLNHELPYSSDSAVGPEASYSRSWLNGSTSPIMVALAERSTILLADLLSQRSRWKMPLP
jgi:hypothetical protein